MRRMGITQAGRQAAAGASGGSSGRHRWRSAAAAAIALAALLVIACGGSKQGTPQPAAPTVATTPAFPRELQDAAGGTVKLAVPARRIVSFSPGATEILYAIGAGDRVVAADQFSNYPAETKTLPKVDYSKPNPEQVIALQPDLVLFATRQQPQLDQFRGLNIPVLLLKEPDSLDGVYAHIALLGEATGTTERANIVVSGMRTRVQAVTAKVADVQQGPMVFYEVSKDLYTAAPNTFIGALITLLKGRNVAQGATTAFPQLSAEAVIAAKPDVVLLSDAQYGETPEQVAARPGWAEVPAVKTKRLYPVDADLLNRPGPRLADGIEQLAKALYPDRFTR